MQNFTHPLASHTMSLNKNSNTGICGAYAYRIDGDRILDPGDNGKCVYPIFSLL